MSEDCKFSKNCSHSSRILSAVSSRGDLPKCFTDWFTRTTMAPRILIILDALPKVRKPCEAISSVRSVRSEKYQRRPAGWSERERYQAPSDLLRV